jgi:hypothetical protein
MHLVCACQCPAVTDREFENGDVVFGELLRKTGSDSQIVECQRVPRSISHTHDFKSKSPSTSFDRFRWFSLFVCSTQAAILPHAVYLFWPVQARPRGIALCPPFHPSLGPRGAPPAPEPPRGARRRPRRATRAPGPHGPPWSTD